MPRLSCETKPSKLFSFYLVQINCWLFLPPLRKKKREIIARILKTIYYTIKILGETCIQYQILNKEILYFSIVWVFRSIFVAANVFIIISKGEFHGLWRNVLIILINKYRQMEPPLLASEVSTCDKRYPELKLP